MLFQDAEVDKRVHVRRGLAAAAGPVATGVDERQVCLLLLPPELDQLPPPAPVDEPGDRGERGLLEPTVAVELLLLLERR